MDAGALVFEPRKARNTRKEEMVWFSFFDYKFFRVISVFRGCEI